VVFMLVYIKMSDVVSRSGLFNLMIWFFISYFVVFALTLYPAGDAVVIDFSRWLGAEVINGRLKYLLSILSNWHYSCFYLFSEMWVTIMFSISFWQVANHITAIEESKMYYPLLGIASQFGLMLASILAGLFAKAGEDWQVTLNKSVISVVIAGVILSLTIKILVSLIGENLFNSKENIFAKQRKPKVKTNFKESLKIIASSKPILLIASLLLCYNISINLVEGVWKKSIEVFFANDASRIQVFMGGVNFYISIFSVLFALGGMYVIRTFKWTVAALITPLTFAIAGGAFFVCIIFKDHLLAVTIGISALQMAVYVGAIHNIAARSSKHTIFDSTKEMAYIPLEDDLKTKGKAAAEMIGMRFGKGCGAFMQQILLTVFAGLTLMDLAPIIGVIFVMVMVWWIYSTCALGRLLGNKLNS
jgi:ATP/ADP translocase